MDGRVDLKIVAHSEEEMLEAARSFASLLEPGDIVLLKGDLGSGKTTFVRGIGERFSKEQVSSPTFVYLHIYGELAHFDLYRIKDQKTFLMRGFDEYLEPPYITCIEWPEKILDILPPQRYEISFSYKGKGREIVITNSKRP